jgi:putative ABC transport system ATP-binding protein
MLADLSVESLTVSYADQDQVVHPLQDLSFAAGDGQVVVVMGPSGCGKTTLLSVLAGLLTPDAGTVSFAGRELTGMSRRALLEHRRHTVGIVFQAFNLVPSLTAVENVMSPLLLTGVRARTARKQALELLDEVGLAGEAARRPGRLSGGQQQRVAFARALVGRPALLLADEPTAHLDPDQVDNVLRMIDSLRCAGRLVVVATHDERFGEVADAYVRLGHAPLPTKPEAAGPVLLRQRHGHHRQSPGKTAGLTPIREVGREVGP